VARKLGAMASWILHQHDLARSGTTEVEDERFAWARQCGVSFLVRQNALMKRGAHFYFNFWSHLVPFSRSKQKGTKAGLYANCTNLREFWLGSDGLELRRRLRGCCDALADLTRFSFSLFALLFLRAL